MSYYLQQWCPELSSNTAHVTLINKINQPCGKQTTHMSIIPTTNFYCL